jgi:hypothetical protein
MIQIFNSHKLPDFIGDIHGHYDHLIKLLLKLGYKKYKDEYIHKERIPVFLGDYINRGPDSLAVVDLIIKMQRAGNAYALMGNHEFNFLAYHFKDKAGIFFRPNTETYYGYISASKKPIDESGRLIEILNWMQDLPLIITGEYFTAVHAQWSQQYEEVISYSGLKKMDENSMRYIHQNNELLNPVSEVLKGKEIELNNDFDLKYGLTLKNKKFRFLWWKTNRTNKLKDWMDVPNEFKNILIEKEDLLDFENISDQNKPIFFGHYWLNPIEFGLQSDKWCCLDYSVANGGFIGAYRFNNELNLVESNLTHS